jgi:hypothetical protein
VWTGGGYNLSAVAAAKPEIRGAGALRARCWCFLGPLRARAGSMQVARYHALLHTGAGSECAGERRREGGVKKRGKGRRISLGLLVCTLEGGSVNICFKYQLAHAPLVWPLLYTPHVPLPCLIAIQCHARRGAAPPAYQCYHTGPCSWRSALASPAL